MLLRGLFNQSPSRESSIERDPSALSDVERRQHEARARRLFEEKREVRDVLDGIAVQFPGTMAHAERALDFIRYERRCCSFLTFDLAFEPEARAIWLYIGGDERAQAYVDHWYERLIGEASSSKQA